MEAGRLVPQPKHHARGPRRRRLCRFGRREDRTFTLTEIGTTAGVPYSQAYNWLTEGVIVPSVRPATGAGKGREPLFSWADAFVAGICGSFGVRA